jgi:hypothetical protein
MMAMVIPIDGGRLLGEGQLGLIPSISVATVAIKKFSQIEMHTF